MSKLRFKSQTVAIDKKLLVVTVVLILLGLVALTDASAPIALRDFSDKYYFAKQQLIWALLGFVIMIIVSKIHYLVWKRLATYIFFGAVMMLIVVLIPGVGSKLLGAKRWILLGPLSFQPAEFAKLAISMYIAKVASSEKRTASFLLPIALVSFLIMLEPDLGTTIVVAGIGIVQAFLAGINIFYFLGAMTSAAIATILLIITSDYRRARLLTFLESATDPLGSAYHIRQILLSLGIGGLFGIGLGQSRQKFLFLPEAATDSIFAVIAEEVGFIGAGALIMLFAYFIFRGYKIVISSPDKFSFILSAGIVTWIGGQTLLNIGSMVALVPLTGIPLPLFSYGGSSLTTVLLAIGILLNISKYGKKVK